MPLTTGTQLGRFDVIAPLGSGGMGEVYRARDRDLGREVAIKVLPAAFATDPQRLARFEREARAAAALNHPNILVVFEVGTTAETPFVAFELLHGQTLRDLLGRPWAVDKAMEMGVQIAEGLGAAHEGGVIHRDIKPENLFVTADGRLKILDFGIATTNQVSSTDETRARLTAPGDALGTAGYMAPEQVRGEAVDARADVFALGAVLYEMLSGRRAFPGRTSADGITATLRDDPAPLHTILPGLAGGVDEVVHRCLAKRREQRFQSARDVAFALRLATRPSEAGTAPRIRQAAARWIAAGLLATLAIGAAAARYWPGTAAAGPSQRLAMTFPSTDPLGRDDFVPFAVSPDASVLAYTTSQPERLLLRRLDSFEVVRVGGSDGAYDPFFSPDGQWLGFWAFGQIKKVPVAGGPPVVVCQAADMTGASWGPNGSIVFAPGFGEGLFVVPDTGGTPRRLTTVDPARREIQHTFPQVVGGGRAVVFTAMARSKDAPYSVELFDMASNTRRTLMAGAQYGRYLPTGHLLFVRNGTVFAVRVSEKLEPTGPVIPVVREVQAGSQGQALFSVAGDGTLMYVSAEPAASSTPVWVDRTGAATETGLPPRAYQYPRIAPDGKTIVVIVEDGSGVADIWGGATGRATLERLTFGRRAGFSFSGVAISPDGARVAYAEDSDSGSSLVTQRLDGSEPKQPHLARTMQIGPSRWMPAGDVVLFSERGAASGGDVWAIGGSAGAQPGALTQEPGNQFGATPSRDGRYIVYASDETGRFELFARPYDGPGPKRQVTTEGGTEPIWSPDGREIIYRSGDRVMSIGVATTPSLQFQAPRVLFEGRFVQGAAGLPAYDVAPDGRLLMLRPIGTTAPRELRVVTHLFRELDTAVDSRRPGR